MQSKVFVRLGRGDISCLVRRALYGRQTVHGGPGQVLPVGGLLRRSRAENPRGVCVVSPEFLLAISFLRRPPLFFLPVPGNGRGLGGTPRQVEAAALGGGR